MSEIGEIQTPHVADTEPVEDEDNIYESDSEEVVHPRIQAPGKISESW